MKHRSWIAVGLGVYVLALLITAPATLLDSSLQDASDGRLRLADAQGTLWSGTAQFEIRDADGRTGLAKHLAWHVRPWEALRARLVYEVELDPGMPAFLATIFWSRIELRNADISFSAEVLSLVPKLAPLELTGDMNLQIPILSIGRNNTAGSATLKWRVAGSLLSPVSPLGDYQLQLEGKGRELGITLKTLQGPLQLNGQGSWTGGRKPLFLATAHMSSAYQPRLAPFLRLIAVERSDGSFELQFK